MARSTLSHGRLETTNELSEVLCLGFGHSENMKGKALGLATANTREFFEVGDEFVEVGHRKIE
jgi:hypothetical protein